MRYDGFISYSHGADGRLAPALQKALQHLAKPWYRRTALNVFRDETGLSVDPHLWGAIVAALDDAEWFILLCSPAAAQSEWVNREVEHWKATRPVDRILPVVTDGHWEWDTEAGDLTTESDAVPPALRGVFTDEPRHLDLRWAHREEHLDLRDSRFRNAVAEIAAPLHGRTKDEIEGEDIRQHRRTVRIAWSAATTLALLTVISVVAGGFAVHNANRAEQRRVLAESQRLAGYSQNEPAGSELGFLLAAQGYRMDANPVTEAALFRSVAEAPPEIKQRIPAGGPVTAVAISTAADRVWTGTATGELLASRFSDGAEVARAGDVFTHAVAAMVQLDADTVAVTDGTVVVTVDAGLTPSMRRFAGSALTTLAADPATGRIAAGSVEGMVFVWAPDAELPTATFAGVPGVAPTDFVGVSALAWTADGDLIVAGKDGGLRRFDPAAAGRPVWEHRDTAAAGEWVSALAVLPGNTIATGGTDGAVGFRDGSSGAATATDPAVAHTGSVRGLAVTGDTPEQGSLASVGDDGRLRFFDHLTGEPVLAPLRVDEVTTAVAWDPAQPLHGVVGGQGGATVLDYGAERLPAIAHQIAGWSNVAAVAMSAGGDRLAVVRTDPALEPPVSELVLTDPSTPDPTASTVRIDGLVEQLTFTPDGALVLAGTDSGAVAVWDGHTAQATMTTVADGQVVSQLAVSPDGTTVATGGITLSADSGPGAPVRLWSFDDRRLVPAGQSSTHAFGYGLAFTPDGRRLIIGGISEFTIEDLDSGAGVSVDLTDDMTRSLTVAPDGRTVAVGLWSGPIRFFDLNTGEPTGDDLRQPQRATEIRFRGNTVLVTVSNDGGFRLWDLISLRALSDDRLAWVDTGARVPSAPSLGLGADLAVTASLLDGRLVQWSLSPADWITAGCTRYLRELSDAEKRRFGLDRAAPVC